MFFILDKQKGISSFKAISNWGKENNIKKIGHTGTLDPIATGLLLIATNEDTKLIPYLGKGVKKYLATAKLGYKSTTYDAEGELEEVSSIFPDESIVEEYIKNLIHIKKQLPPAFSAKKINGQRAYKLARENKEVNLKSQDIEIISTKFIGYKKDEIIFEITVSRGTYIRSIIHDMGQHFECGAYMLELRRVQIDNFSEEHIGEVDVKHMLNKPIMNINEKVLIDLFRGIKQKIEGTGNFILQYKNTIIGLISLESDNVIKQKLFGKRIEGMLNEGS